MDLIIFIIIFHKRFSNQILIDLLKIEDPTDLMYSLSPVSLHSLKQYGVTLIKQNQWIDHVYVQNIWTDYI